MLLFNLIKVSFNLYIFCHCHPFSKTCLTYLRMNLPTCVELNLHALLFSTIGKVDEVWLWANRLGLIAGISKWWNDHIVRKCCFHPASGKRHEFWPFYTLITSRTLLPNIYNTCRFQYLYGSHMLKSGVYCTIISPGLWCWLCLDLHDFIWKGCGFAV